MSEVKAIVILLAWLASFPVFGHDYYLGSCPRVEPIDNFDITKFLGRWYVIQKFSTASSCWTYDFIRNATDGSLKIVQSRDHVALDTIGLDNNYRYVGTLDVPDSNRQGFMRVRFPLSLAGKADYVVFATDYDNYGAIYSCQSILFGHRRSSSILSRRPTLDQMYINKVRTKLDNFGVDPHDFSIIDHSDCKTLSSTSLLNGEVGPDTFSPTNIVNTVKGVGSVIVNGVVGAAETAGTLYTRYVGNGTVGHAPVVPATVTQVGGTGTRRLPGAGRPDDDAELVTVNKVPETTNL